MQPATNGGPTSYLTGPVAREIPIDSVDGVARAVVAIGNDYPDGHRVKPHHHRRGQLISGATGVIVLSTAEGAWAMPPKRGLWIPPAKEHRVQMVGAARVQSLWVERPAFPGWPSRCQVVGISPFMR